MRPQGIEPMSRSLYKGWSGERLSAFARPACVAMLISAAQALGGCSMPLGSMFGGNDKHDPDTTASISPTPIRETLPVASAPPSEADLAYARAAATEVIARNGKDLSQPWENPNTGARGSVTPLTSAYDSNGTTCRDFIASYLRDSTETWFQGEACKFASRWEVRSMKPWRNKS